MHTLLSLLGLRQFILNLQQCETHKFLITWKTLCKSSHFLYHLTIQLLGKTSRSIKSIFTDKGHQSMSLLRDQCGVEGSYFGKTVCQKTAVSIAPIAGLDLNCFPAADVLELSLVPKTSGLLIHDFPFRLC